jgi:hypothetical protein
MSFPIGCIELKSLFGLLQRGMGISSVCQRLRVHFGEAHRWECITSKPPNKAGKIAKNSCTNGTASSMMSAAASTNHPLRTSRNLSRNISVAENMARHIPIASNLCEFAQLVGHVGCEEQ